MKKYMKNIQIYVVVVSSGRWRRRVLLRKRSKWVQCWVCTVWGGSKPNQIKLLSVCTDSTRVGMYGHIWSEIWCLDNGYGLTSRGVAIYCITGHVFVIATSQIASDTTRIWLWCIIVSHCVIPDICHGCHGHCLRRKFCHVDKFYMWTHSRCGDTKDGEKH